MKPALTSFDRRASRWLVTSALCALLAACGGGESSGVVQGTAPSAAQANADQALSATAPDAAAFARGAALNTAELAAAEQRAQAIAEGSDAANPAPALESLAAGQIASKSAYTSGVVAKTASAVRVPAYRFYNSTTGGHLYTGAAERDFVIATYSPPFAYEEGERFSVANEFAPGLSPVHRFFNTTTGVHFYTISETERAYVVATYPQFRYEEVVYYASQVAGAGLVPLYRFYAPSRGFHFYTASESEKDSVIALYPDVYNFEGVGFYVLDSNWRAEKLPHTGITSNQCFEADTNALTSCSRATTKALNPQQDGHLANVNPLTYGRVGARSVTECVQDKVTGLIWEGKQISGLPRSGVKVYTNLGNSLADDASGHLNAVNATNLCGFNDWRLPTAAELHGLADASKITMPRLDTTWFVNSSHGDGAQSHIYWSSEVNSDSPPGTAYAVTFNFVRVYNKRSTGPLAVRLVRGAPASGTRFTYSTVAYSGDAANNVVNEAWTGLQWRRCEQGRVWSGSTCTGSVATVTHEQALNVARRINGWRLPNAKELGSLMDRSVSAAVRSDLTVFPGLLGRVWASTPDVRYAGDAAFVDFDNGEVGNGDRMQTLAIRLVRISP